MSRKRKKKYIVRKCFIDRCEHQLKLLNLSLFMNSKKLVERKKKMSYIHSADVSHETISTRDRTRAWQWTRHPSNTLHCQVVVIVCFRKYCLMVVSGLSNM